MLFWSILSEIEPNTSLGTAKVHQIEIGIRESLIKACLWLLVPLCLVDKNLVDLVKLTIFDDILCYIVLFLLRRQRIEVRTLACKVKPPIDAANLPHVVITKRFRLIKILLLLWKLDQVILILILDHIVRIAAILILTMDINLRSHTLGIR